MLCIYNSGSFLCDEEVPPAARLRILELAASLEHVDEIVIESRCEYVREDEIRRIAQFIHPKHLVVGVGFESASEFVRNRILLKGLDQGCFERASADIRRHAGLLVYVLAGAPFLSEAERIADAVTSIRVAQEHGARTVSLQLCNVQPSSAVQWLWQRGWYRPIWLWSALEIVKQAPVG
ncbi:MAG: TIGR01210 family radical SAM protein, partial [Acidobacteria bacterium]|nr:TIGR01210 family radical SAM protein [Acidobacteriota bacterium]